VTQHEDRAACGASGDPELMESVFGELAALLAPVYRHSDLRQNAASVPRFVRPLQLPFWFC
jgi:hypothetical protein